MNTPKNRFIKNLKRYHFELKHLLILLAVLIFFQVLVSFVYKISLQKFLIETQKWYQRDFAERLANLTATSLEMVLETTLKSRHLEYGDARKIIQAFNIILSQQLLQHHVQEVCILVHNGDEIVAIDNGQVLFAHTFENQHDLPFSNQSHRTAIAMYNQLEKQIITSEQIYSILEGGQTFHVFVPFVPKGEYAGAVYLKITPAFGFVTSSIMSGYNATSLIFTALIFFGLLAMFYISSYTVRERNEAQKLLFEEQEKKLKEHIHLQKEVLFAKRIYHTHHKAEKVMGFIKEDLGMLSLDNIDEIKYRVNKYANFISRVIYDMKWFEPPIHAIRNPLFKTNLNEIIRFVVNNIFLRTSTTSEQYSFDLDLDENLPIVNVNEFVVWEIIDPLVQNSIEHAGDSNIIIKIKSHYHREFSLSVISISDNGTGILPALLERNEQGIKRIFLENISTKNENQRSGYGCYIAYEIATQRCGWQMEVENLPDRGCCFKITIPHN
ncbi:MAG: ATP-binding protein [bacterium]|nr:ATP-binding protein [bacterium]